MSGSLRARLAETPFAGYLYAYPHKTAYRRLDPPVPLAEAWAGEDTGGLFLYLHVPFCEMRCGFCNLFTTVGAREDGIDRYLATLERQARAVRRALEDAGGSAPGVVRLAIGGGTPTFLDPARLRRLFGAVDAFAPGAAGAVPCSVETSPATATAERLGVLAERGVTRVSIGVQSFVEAEVRAVGRSQRTHEVHAALERIRALPFALNVDLMYGLPGQTAATWAESLRAALAYEPEELFLYPLYVRPATGLGRAAPSWDDMRTALYRQARRVLVDAGYEQVSMRLFRRASAAHEVAAPAYCCQTDGMVGLGPGARSYTSWLHYSTEWAVGRAGVRGIVERWCDATGEQLATAWHGVALDGEEQRRRHLIQSLLQRDGLEFAAYQDRFGTDALDDFPSLVELEELGLAVSASGRLRLTAAGLEQSDAIGPWLVSADVEARMREYEVV